MNIDNETELGLLFELVMEAKFSQCLVKKELQGSTPVSLLVKKIADEINSSNRVISLELHDYPQFIKVIEENIMNIETKSWVNISLENKKLYVSNLISPFSTNEKMINDFISIRDN